MDFFKMEVNGFDLDHKNYPVQALIFMQK